MGEVDQLSLDSTNPSARALHVIYNGEACTKTWEELFDAQRFHTLKAVSYVSSPRFLSRLAAAFEQTEVILGIDSPKALRTIEELFGGGNVRFFNGLTDAMRDKAVAETFSVRYSDMNAPIHSKLYLLEGPQGATRLIVGSINLTENALTDRGKFQYEEALVFDNSELFHLFQARYDEIRKHTLDYLPEASIKQWRETRQTIDLSQDGTLEQTVEREIASQEKLIDTFASVEEEFNEVEGRQNAGDANLSAAEIENLEIVKQLKTRSKKSFAIKTGSPLVTALQKVSASLNVVVDADVSEPIPYLTTISTSDGSERFYYATPATESRPQLIGEQFFTEPLTPEQIDAALANIEAFVSTYRTYTVNEVDADYPQWIYEAVLYTMTAPMIERVRLSTAERLQDDSILSDIPIYMVLGGRAGSGKTHLLEYLYKLLSGEQPSSAQWQFLELKKPTAYGRHLDKAFATGNRFPLFVDEVSPSLFKGAGDATIKNLANSLKDKHRYAPVICTTNAADYSPAEGSVRRLKYLPLDEVFDANSNEGRVAFNVVLQACDNRLEKDFLVRFDEALAAGEKAYDENRDYLALTRALFVQYYEEAGREVPVYFPRTLIDKSTIEGKRRWQQLYDDESKKHLFVSIDGGEKMRVEIDSLFSFKPTAKQQSEYADCLPPIVATSKAGKYVELNTEQFFKWIERDNPLAKRSWLKGLFG